QFFTDELNAVGRRLADCDVRIYTYLSGFRTIVASMLIVLLPLPEATCVRMLRNVFRRNRLPVDGFVVAQVVGPSQTMTAQVVYREHRDYWINRVVLATVARWIAERKGVRAGVHFLAEAVEPVAFMEELRSAGVEQREKTATTDKRR